MIMQPCFPVSFFSSFPFWCNFLAPSRAQSRTGNISPRNSFLRHLQKLRLNALSFFHISKDKTVEKNKYPDSPILSENVDFHCQIRTWPFSHDSDSHNNKQITLIVILPSNPYKQWAGWGEKTKAGSTERDLSERKQMSYSNGCSDEFSFLIL